MKNLLKLAPAPKRAPRSPASKRFTWSADKSAALRKAGPSARGDCNCNCDCGGGK